MDDGRSAAALNDGGIINACVKHHACCTYVSRAGARASERSPRASSSITLRAKPSFSRIGLVSSSFSTGTGRVSMVVRVGTGAERVIIQV